MHQITHCPVIEVRSFKWPYCLKSVAKAYLLGEDIYGKWVGIARGDPWHEIDNSRSGVFEKSFVKLLPNNAFWTACFNLGEVIIDVDISLPVKWIDNAVEEIDLELDVLCNINRRVYVRDQEKYIHMRDTLALPAYIASEAEHTCDEVRKQIEQGVEPFSEVGFRWLQCFLDAAGSEHA